MDGMLRRMSARQLRDWLAYARLEPFGQKRREWGIAQLTALYANAHRDTKRRPKPYNIGDFMFHREPAKKKSWEELHAIARTTAAMMGAEFKKKGN